MITTSDGTVLWKLGYTWKKYNVVTNVVEGSSVSIKADRISTIYCWKTVSADLKGSGERKADIAYDYIKYSLYNEYPYFNSSSANDVVTGKCTGGRINASGVSIYYSELSTIEGQGTYIEDVTATDANAYPGNGKHTDGYWYVKQT